MSAIKVREKERKIDNVERHIPWKRIWENVNMFDFTI
jgi:hypothetical protein